MSNPSPSRTARRGRPSLARVAEIDRNVIATARNLFLAEGFDLVTMEQVAAAANLSKGTLYARHPSKEALFKSVIEATIAEWSAEAGQQDHLLTDDIGQRLRHHAAIIARWLMRSDVMAIMRAMSAVQDRFPKLAQTMHQIGYRYEVMVIARDIADAAQRDGIPADDPERVARTLVTAISGFAWQEQMNGEISPTALEKQAEFVAEMLLTARSRW
jgi:AcrR family transcriptional regulator